MSELPRGWVEVEFGGVFDFKGGSQPPKSEFYDEPGEGRIRLLQIRDFASDEKAIYIQDNGKWPRCSENDIMIGRYGASVGKILSGKFGAYNVALVKIDFPQTVFDRRWVRSYLKTDHFQRPLLQISRSAQNGFNKEDLKEVPVPIPPLPEQKRIVAKLDALNAKSARARTELARIETLVSRYKQAVLSKAFSGELTREWRVRHVIAKDWRPSLIASECDIRLGKMLDKAKNKGEPTLYLRNINVRWGGFDISDVLSMNMTHDERTKLDIRDGDVLVCEGGEPGRCAVWNLGPSDISFQKALMRVRPRPYLISQFFFYFMRWAADENLLAQHFTGTTIKHLPQAALSKVPISVPPLDEQHEIVRRIEAAFAKIDRLATEAKRALELVGKLDEAILAKAFRGELVPQDPDDEPASELLRRLQATSDHRAPARAAGRSRKRST